MRAITCNEIDIALEKRRRIIMGLEMIQSKEQEIRKNISKGYNEYKEFQGRKYTGMRIGGTHHWYYDKGEWKEKKIAPDKWEFNYNTNKRRAWQAPEGSGVPVGSEYHWYILAHQNVRKQDANSYMTSMTGLKYKLAHKRVDRGKWSSTDNAQKEQLIKILEDYVVQLKREMVDKSAQNFAPIIASGSETLSS
jgi:hypothetical protein